MSSAAGEDVYDGEIMVSHNTLHFNIPEHLTSLRGSSYLTKESGSLGSDKRLSLYE